MKRIGNGILSFLVALSSICVFGHEGLAGSLEKRSYAGFGYKISPRYISEDGKGSEYSIDVQYPKLMGRRERVHQFNHEVKMLLMKVMGGFKQNGFERWGETKSFLGIDYRITHAGNDIVSILFNVSTYMAGAAHPNSYTVVMNYSLGRSKVLKFSTLFLPESDYLEFISKYCFENLKAREGILEDELQTGTAPRAENFEGWNFVPAGLLITFDPYKVACYAAGPQEVVIPYPTLAHILRHGYSLE